MKSKEFQHDLSLLINRARTDDEIWRVMSAIRGPDFSSTGMLLLQYDQMTNEDINLLKWYTTARIRGIVFTNGHGDINRRPLSKDEIVLRQALLQKSCTWYGNHFYYHFIDAMKALKEMQYDVPDAEMYFGFLQKEEAKSPSNP